ncbi:hypothetical protein LOTGIDRAFT_236582 [Lottia gigantea]|uniref:Uncharacterized protein n=1 Tax=Lottia gigantea TaxID=225164 RepID=V3ZRB2_LOTGI|nr:hypothetical protein LOTGIDRAFT_236582 [Lottia gigantea]ESO83411.1 hypothetical protein LOTGIDRAFT_236582 [Lottia gigantea]
MSGGNYNPGDSSASSSFGGSKQRSSDGFHTSSSYSSHSSSFQSASGTSHGTDAIASDLLTEKSFLNKAEAQPADERTVENRRQISDETRRVTRPPTRIQCKSCELNGQTYKGHSRFEYREGCINHRCICHCDGSYNCPPTSSTDMCERENLENPNCGTCSVQEREIKGNSYFDMKEDCTLFKNCICRCNGSYECSGQRAENLCPSEIDPTDPPYVEMPTDLDDTDEEDPPQQCQRCYAHGRYHDGNTRFTHLDDCIEYDCDCFCSGEWECPAERAQNICDFDDEQPSTCNECEVNGEFFDGNSYFKRQNGCTEYTCNCHCDGTYDCPINLAKDICESNQTKTCSQCEVSETETYPGESDFVIRKECIQYQCRCNCNGSWNCPGSEARNVCKGEQLGGCRNCEISQNEYYQGDTNFNLTKGCIGYSCKCFCNGSWSCPGEDARDTCKGEVIGGCKSCTLSDREYYPGETDFEMKRGCILYQCRCNCDGGWNCPGFKAKDVCKNPDSETTYTKQTCSPCRISRGEIHQPNTYFDMERGCYQYNCTCNCDGSHSCPQSPTKNICDVSPDQTNEFRERQEREFQRQRQREQERMRQEQQRLAFERQRQREEAIRNARQRSRFETTQTDNTQDIERRRERARRLRERTEYERSRKTRVEAGAVESNRRVEATNNRRVDAIGNRRVETTNNRRAETTNNRRGEATYNGRAETTNNRRVETTNYRRGEATYNGRAETTNNRRTETTNNRRAGTSNNRRVETTNTERQANRNEKNGTFIPEYTQPCLKCSFAGKTHPGNTRFEYTRGCYTYNCSCDCNGRWNCDRDNVVYTCNRTRNNPVRQVSPQPRRETPTYRVTSNRQANSRVSNAAALSNPDTSSQQNAQSTRRTYPVYHASQPRNVPLKNYGTSNVRYSQQTVLKTNPAATDILRNNRKIDGSANHNEQTVSATRYEQQSSNGASHLGKGTHSMHTSTHHSYRQTNPFLRYTQPIGLPGYRIVPQPGSPDFRPLPPLPGYRTQTHSSSFAKYPINPSTHNLGSRQIIPSNVPSIKTPTYPVGGVGVSYPPGTDETTNLDSCQRCLADGKYYSVNDKFDMNRNCVIYKCRCMCNGNYRCAITPNPTCQSGTVDKKCGNCYVGGLVYPGNMGFQQRKGCFELTCQCKCDGTYDCPEEKKVNLCPSNGPALPTVSNIQSDCAMCDIEGQTYAGNSQFKIYKQCFVYNCNCDCKGEWKCSGEHASGCISANGAVTVGYPDLKKSGSCTKCVVHDESYSPNTNFTLTQGCSQYNCLCNCDGNWYCPSQSPRVTCDARAIQRKESSCQSCDVRGTIYPADATFVLREGCHQHTCTCNCDGTWRCPYNSTINVCETRRDSSESGQGVCKSCDVNGKKYMTNSKFKFREGCALYSCQCFCNGSWECPSEKVENMCRAPDYRIDGCKECRVSNHSYPGGSPFSYKEGCWEFNCMCGCDGKYSCPPDRSVDVCESAGSVSSRCKPCVIESKVIRSKSSFNLRQGCNEYICECGCDGKLNCPEERSINTCELEGKPGISKTDKVAQGCKVANRTYFRRIFGYTENCLQYTCICYDNGAWRCPASKTKRVC